MTAIPVPPARSQESSACEQPTVFEIVPTVDLPLLDLSRSVGKELLRFLCGSRVAVHPCTDVDLRGSIESRKNARAVMGVYYLGHALGIAACLVSKQVSIPLAIAGLVCTLPGSFASLILLRFDVFKLVLRTYDFWFYTSVNTSTCVFFSLGLGDARACVAVILWLGNLHTSFVDANTRLICYLMGGSLVTIALNLALALAISNSWIDDWTAIEIATASKRPIDMDSIIANGIATMVILLARNVIRRDWELRQQAKIGCPMLRCLNLRCLITWRQWNKQHQDRVAAAVGDTHAKTYHISPHQFDQMSMIQFPKSQMYYVRPPSIVFDSTSTFYPVQLDPLRWGRWERLAFMGTGVIAVSLTAAVFAVHPSKATQPLAVSGLCLSMMSFGLTFCLLQRTALMKIISSFDFLFLSVQLSLGLLCGSMLFHWDTRSVALASLWIWLHWVLTIDALSPLMKKKIGVNMKILLVPTLLLFIVGVVIILVDIRWLDRWKIEDQVLIHFSPQYKIQVLPFFVSRTMMTLLWALRLLWRVLTNPDDSTCVVMLGRMGYLYTHSSDNHGANNTMPVPVPTKPRAQVAPLELEK